MKHGLIRMLALALPLVGLGATWAVTHDRAQQGVVWEVPVAGYDPRDLLRGHYIVYRYEWPGLESGQELQWSSRLCIEGTAPVIAKTSPVMLKGYREDDCEHQLVRAPEVAHEAIRGLDSGILYVSQERARELQKKLWDPKLQGAVRIRVRDDGLITPLDIVFRPRPDAEPENPLN